MKGEEGKRPLTQLSKEEKMCKRTAATEMERTTSVQRNMHLTVLQH